MFRALSLTAGLALLAACAEQAPLLEPAKTAPTQWLQASLIESVFMDAPNPYAVSATWTYDPADEGCPSELLVEVEFLDGGGVSFDRDCDAPIVPEFIRKDPALEQALARIAASSDPDPERMLKQIRGLIK